MNTFGTLFRLTDFGESHGKAIGGVIDGMPAGFPIDLDEVQRQLDRRRPGQSAITTARKESDTVEFLSGIMDGQSLGTPIGFVIRNSDQHSSDYGNLQHAFRPNHADYTYYKKYGIHEFAGGGRASARETVNWVVAGALCREWLKTKGIEVSAYFEECNSVEEAMQKGDSTGGIVHGVINRLPVGIGEPVFDKLHARLGYAMMSIPAAKGFDIGFGVGMASMFGSEVMDVMNPDGTFRSNYSGGILGGISNGMPVEFSVFFKPTSSIMQPRPGVTPDGKPCVIPPKGRHDPCVAIRAVPVVEALAWLVVADLVRMR